MGTVSAQWMQRLLSQPALIKGSPLTNLIEMAPPIGYDSEGLKITFKNSSKKVKKLRNWTQLLAKALNIMLFDIGYSLHWRCRL